MINDLCIHDVDKNLERYLETLKISDITERNRQLILNFQEHCYSRGLTKYRILFYITKLNRLAKILKKDFDSANKEDIERLAAEIEKSDYTDWTKHDYRVTIKIFYRWLEGNDEEYPKKVKWIKTTVKNHNKRLPEEILTKEEIRKLIQAADNTRNKAFIAILYESGCRVSEIANLKLKHIVFDQYGAQLIVSGKTGMRRVRLIASVSYLSAWLGCHPQKDNPDAPVWVTIATNNNGNHIGYQSIRKLLKEIADKAGVKKAVNPHSFRHARATHLANKLTEAQLKQMFGWNQSSTMASIYIHISGRDVDDALLRINGKLPKEDKMDTIVCPRCNEWNPETFRFCQQCGMPLDLKAAVEKEETRDKYDVTMSKLIERMIQEPKMKDVITEFLKEIKN